MPKSQDQKPLDDFAAKIHKVREDAGLTPKPKAKQDDGASFAVGYRVAVDIVVSLAACTAIGWGIDYLTGWAPWAMLVGLVLGFAAGINNAVRTAMKIDRAALEAMRRPTEKKEDQTPSSQ